MKILIAYENVETGVELVSDCCGAPVAEHRPEDTHARCNSCGEMAVIDKITEVARC